MPRKKKGQYKKSPAPSPPKGAASIAGTAQKSAVTSKVTTPQNAAVVPGKTTVANPNPVQPVQPEQMSLEAYTHVQECLERKAVTALPKEDVTAVIQLAQHLRVFGLLSAVGYVRHAREGKIRARIRPMWMPLLWRLIFGSDAKIPTNDSQARQNLMDETYKLSTQDPKGYMVKWRLALKLANHWNFWARAFQEEDKTDEQRTEDSNTAG